MHENRPIDDTDGDGAGQGEANFGRRERLPVLHRTAIGPGSRGQRAVRNRRCNKRSAQSGGCVRACHGHRCQVRRHHELGAAKRVGSPGRCRTRTAAPSATARQSTASGFRMVACAVQWERTSISRARKRHKLLMSTTLWTTPVFRSERRRKLAAPAHSGRHSLAPHSAPCPASAWPGGEVHLRFILRLPPEKAAVIGR